VEGEVRLVVEGPATLRSVLDALEARYPVLRGTVRDHGTLKRRPFIRFFACKEDLSLEPPETTLPDSVVSGDEPFLIVGAMAVPVAASDSGLLSVLSFFLAHLSAQDKRLPQAPPPPRKKSTKTPAPMTPPSRT
jgi:hypothetical protein